jgi:hypothetical protein
MLAFTALKKSLFLNFLVLDDLEVYVVGVIGCPLKEGLVRVGDCVKFYFSLDARYVDGGFSLHHFISNGKVFIGYLGH